MKRQGYLVLAAFLAGIVGANLMGEHILTTYGILNTFYLDQYTNTQLAYEHLLVRICIVRLKSAGVLWLLGSVIKGTAFFLLSKCFVAGTVGFFMVAAIENMGAAGLIVAVCALLPQWVFYLLAWLLYSSCRIKMSHYVSGNQRLEYIGVYAVIFLCIGAGIVTETYLNPLLLQQILKYF